MPLTHTNFNLPCEVEDVVRNTVVDTTLKIPFLTQKERNYHNFQLETLLATRINQITDENATQELEIFYDNVYLYFKGVFGKVQLNCEKTSGERSCNLFKTKLRRRKRQQRKEFKETKKVKI